MSWMIHFLDKNKENVRLLYSYLRSFINNLKKKQHNLSERLLRIRSIKLIVCTLRGLDANDATHMAAGVSYYAILSLFPLIIGLVSILSFFMPEKSVISFFEDNIPGLASAVQDNIKNITSWRATFGIVGLIALFWSATSMFGAITRAVNRAWGIRKNRPFYIRRLHDFAMAFGTGFLFLLSFSASSVFSIFREMDLPFSNTATDIIARLLAFLLTIVVFLLIFKFTPNTKTFWSYVWPGALISAVLFEIAKTVFVLYLDRFANYSSVYGSLTSVVIVLVWIYFSALILIIGAQFSSEYERLRTDVEEG